MGSGSQETVDFVWSEDVTRATALSGAPEKVGWRHLVTLVFRVQCTRQTADGEQSIMALADRGRTCCPLQDRVRLDKFFGPPLGKIHEAVEHVCLDLVLIDLCINNATINAKKGEVRIGECRPVVSSATVESDQWIA